MGTHSKTQNTYVPGFRSLAFVVLLAAVLGHSSAWAQQPSSASGKEKTQVRYTDVRQTAGIGFLQDSTQTDEKYYLETMGTGVAWLDYDQDGLMDLFFAQSGATDFYKPDHPLRSALYNNNGDGTFTDVTEKASVADDGHYGQRVALHDHDDDAHPA